MRICEKDRISTQSERFGTLELLCIGILLQTKKTRGGCASGSENYIIFLTLKKALFLGWPVPNKLQDLLAFLQPGHRVVDMFQITNHPIFIDHKRSGALNTNEVFRHFIQMIDRSFRISQDRKGDFEDILVSNGLFQSISQDHQDLDLRFDQFIIRSTQLADIKATLCSDVLSNKEKDDFLSPIIRK